MSARVDIVVPTVVGREESLDRLVASVEAHVPDHRMIVVRDVPTCGIGWISGIRRSSAPYLLLACDDIELESELDAAIEAVDEGYIPAPVIHRPDGSIESAGGDMGAPGCLLTDVQPDWALVDFTPLPFVSRAQIKKVRMIEAHYMTDVYLSHKGRQLGYETVLRHEFKLIHHHHMTGRRGVSADDHRLYREAMSDGS